MLSDDFFIKFARNLKVNSMPDSEVHFIKLSHSEPIDRTKNRLKALFKKAGLDEILSPGEFVAIKAHFGEKGNVTFLDPRYIEPIVRMVKASGAKPFLTDTCVLYSGARDNAVDHLLTANAHGYNIETVGAPVIIADGIIGKNETEIEINAPIFQKVAVAAELISANSIIVVSHATGHVTVGMAATLKNLGMGMASRKGKMTQHSISKPIIKPERCIACGTCARSCPVQAITVTEKAFIDESICIGCGECLAVCRYKAVKFRWNSTAEELQKRIVEHALGIIKQKNGKIGYLTFLVNMAKDCDCINKKSAIMLDDIGVLAGKDPVAIDQAVFDLTKSHAGQSLSELSFPGIDATVQLAYAEQLGLGSRKYHLIEEEI